MANETVLFKRGDSATITSTPVTDGQILFDTSGNGKMYLDNGTDRLEMGGAITVDASLSKTSTNAIQNKAVTGNILNSLAEVSAATQQNTIAGALALKEVNSSLGNMIGIEFHNFMEIPHKYGIWCACVYGSPSDSPYPNSEGWWNVICFGIGGELPRIVQITSQVYRAEFGFKGKNELWIRSLHDEVWSEWTKL